MKLSARYQARPIITVVSSTKSFPFSRLFERVHLLGENSFVSVYHFHLPRERTAMLLEAAAIHYHVGEIQATCLSSQVLLSRHQDGTLLLEPITSSSVPAMLRHQPAHTIELPNARLVSVSMGINRHHVHVRMLFGHIDIVVSSRSDMAKWRDALQPMNASTAHTSTCSSQLGSLGPIGITRMENDSTYLSSSFSRQHVLSR